MSRTRLMIRTHESEWTIKIDTTTLDSDKLWQYGALSGVDYYIDWGDGSAIEHSTGTQLYHYYPSTSGIYTQRLWGTQGPSINLDSDDAGGKDQRPCLLEIKCGIMPFYQFIIEDGDVDSNLTIFETDINGINISDVSPKIQYRLSTYMNLDKFYIGNNYGNFNEMFIRTWVKQINPFMFKYYTDSSLTLSSMFSHSVFQNREIPENLFKPLINNNVECDVSDMFYESNINGEAPDIWNTLNTSDHSGCFYGCTNLTNYNDIPSDWK